MVINSVEELFGTLQQAVIASWRKHLRTAKYSKHMALDEFYKEMPELVDNLIEAWMGVNGRKIKDFTNVIQSKNFNTIKYLKELRSVVKSGYPLMNGEKNLEAALDDIMELIDSTLYKVKELNETHMNLVDYINESLMLNEGITVKKFEADANDIESVINHLGTAYKVKFNKGMRKDFDLAFEELDELVQEHGEILNIYSNRQDATGFKDGMSDILIGKKYMICVYFNDNTHFYWNNDDKEWKKYGFEGKIIN